MKVTRRNLLAGVTTMLATGAAAEAPLTSLRPRARIPVSDPAARIIKQAGLSGVVGCVVADLQSGEAFEAVEPDVALPPASVTKAFTALYAIEALGADHQFETRVIAVGNLQDGKLDGDLILAGGGDPNLVTDQLAELAETLKASGLREVSGDFLVWDNALVNLDEIDDTQLDHVGYNPAVTGLNLNFNRVHFEWKREGTTYTTALDARSEKYRPAVTTARMRVVDRGAPVFTYQERDGVDDWTVARRALNNGGSRWLPVRRPALYAGEVFATFARSQGIVLKQPKEVSELPQGRTLTSLRSAPLDQMMGSMLRYSTNITAEAAGLSATAALTGSQRGLRTSALGMARWAGQRAGIDAHFVDHSGLGDQSSVSASDMVAFLTADRAATTLRPLMKRINMVDGNRKVIRDHPGLVQAKTGTLNFVSCLAGYVRTAGGQDLAFAFLGADLEKRERGKQAGDESPAGSVQWNRKAKALQQRLLQHWIKRGV